MATTHREGSVVYHEGPAPPVEQPGLAPGFSNTPAAAPPASDAPRTGEPAAAKTTAKEPELPAAAAPSRAGKGKRLNAKKPATKKRR